MTKKSNQRRRKYKGRYYYKRKNWLNKLKKTAVDSATESIAEYAAEKLGKSKFSKWFWKLIFPFLLSLFFSLLAPLFLITLDIAKYFLAVALLIIAFNLITWFITLFIKPTKPKNINLTNRPVRSMEQGFKAYVDKETKIIEDTEKKCKSKDIALSQKLEKIDLPKSDLTSYKELATPKEEDNNN